MIARLVIVVLAGVVASLSWAAPPEPFKHGSPSPFRPRMDAFLAGTPEADTPRFERVLPPFAMPDFGKTPDVIHIVFMAKSRPVWIKATILRDHQALSLAWLEQMKTLFNSWDRDKDGYLNRFEAENIYGVTSFRLIFNGGYYSRASGPPPTLQEIDVDKDNKLSLAEVSAYYWPHVREDIVRTKPMPNTNANDNLTEELFLRLDLNRDGKLTQEELAKAEELLRVLDGNEDECISAGELLANPIKKNITIDKAMMAMAENTMAMMGGNTTTAKKTPIVQDVLIHQQTLPDVSGFLLKKYDTNNNKTLNRREFAISLEQFEKLDTNKDGELSDQELMNWVKGMPDAELSLDFSEKAGECKATQGKDWPAWLNMQPSQPYRLVLRVGSQTMDFLVTAPPDKARYQAARGFVETLFPSGAMSLTEKELVGPQYQYLRIVFDAADADADGKLTRSEAIAYFELQRKTAEYGLVLSSAIRTPNLFELLDDNRDGKLSVRELRTAWERLRPLEPSKSLAITSAIMQPCLTVRLQAAPYVNYEAEFGVPGQGSQTGKGPLWFRKMDRNGDGDVSFNEFLGSREDFDTVDTNQDKLISLQEALAYEAKVRPSPKK